MANSAITYIIAATTIAMSVTAFDGICHESRRSVPKAPPTQITEAMSGFTKVTKTDGRTSVYFAMKYTLSTVQTT